jgi:hypothetical protein
MMKGQYHAGRPCSAAQPAPRLRLLVCITVLAVALTVAWPQQTRAHGDIEPPSVPENLEVPPGHKVSLEARAEGTQNYICLPLGSGLSWTFFGRQATLFNDKDRQTTTHFLSANPEPKDSGMLRPAWRHSRDTSTVWARQVMAATSVDPAFVAKGAIPWVLLEVVGAKAGPTGGQRLTWAKLIQRLNTSSGMAPSTPCAAVGESAFVPYAADYFSYKAATRE